MDSERNEDLNPRHDDIEERVKQMLDPAVPDEKETAADAAPKRIKVADTLPKPVITDEEPKQDAGTLSAPELPGDKLSKKSLDKTTGSKKIPIPVTHDSDTSANDTAPPVTKITIDDDSSTAADIAEKLDATIAGMDSGSDVDKSTEEEPNIGVSPIKAKNDTTEKVTSDEPMEPELPVNDPAVLSDPATDKAIDEIVAAESDELLEMEDAVRDTNEPVDPPKKQRKKLSVMLKNLWAKPLFRWSLLVLLLGGLLVLGAVPQSRYFLLNTSGVRASSSLTVLDDSTQQPLKNVQVKIGEISSTTDVNGKAQLAKLHLGNNTLIVEKRAFAPVHKTITLGWGSNPLGGIKLKPTGNQYSFKVTDFLSGKPIAKVEASSADASALSDDKGDIKLTIDKPDDSKLTVTLKGEGFRTEQLDLDQDNKAIINTKLVPAHKQVFVSKRSGKYDIYSIYIDGKDEKLLLAGSGKEREDMILVPHPSDNIAAYVSTRAGQSNNEGYLLSNLILINTENNTTTNVGASERVQIVDWSGDYLVYVQIASGTSASSPKRYRLMSYNYKDETEKELASSNYFNDVIFADGTIYYAPSAAYQTGPTNFYKVSPDGSGNQVVFGKEVWNIFRTSYDHFALSVQQQWYDYRLGGSQPTKLNTAPSDQTTRVYIDSPDKKYSLWIDNRDGKGVLLAYDTSAKTDAVLHTQTGITYPLRWLDNKVLVYRIKSPQETADYAISIEGGDPVKIRDVTNSGGIDRWYYY